MSRILFVVTVIGAVFSGVVADGVRAFAAQPIDTVVWVGGASGEWNDANAWKNTTTNVIGNALTVLGQRDGSNGLSSLDPALNRARNIEIGGGAVVEYYYPLGGPNGDFLSNFRIKQGSTLTIKEGAVWAQETDSTYNENGWTQMDASLLVLDGGTFRRTGDVAPDFGGGGLMFGSYRADDNFATLPPPATIDVVVKNGGKIENTGSLWFGADEDQPAGVIVEFTITGGEMDLTGGDVAPDVSGTLEVMADLAFFYDYDEDALSPKNEQYHINFTGPGSITVDRAGIYVYRQVEPFVWTGEEAPVTYETLWAQGILQANGLSGLDGASFGEFFTTIGAPGMDNYTLTSLVPIPEPAGAVLVAIGLAGAFPALGRNIRRKN